MQLLFNRKERIKPSKIPPFTIRLDNITKQKLQAIADSQQRSINKEILFLIQEEIKRFEHIYGEIKIEGDNSGTINM